MLRLKLRRCYALPPRPCRDATPMPRRYAISRCHDAAFVALCAVTILLRHTLQRCYAAYSPRFAAAVFAAPCCLLPCCYAYADVVAPCQALPRCRRCWRHADEGAMLLLLPPLLLSPRCQRCHAATPPHAGAAMNTPLLQRLFATVKRRLTLLPPCRHAMLVTLPPCRLRC